MYYYYFFSQPEFMAHPNGPRLKLATFKHFRGFEDVQLQLAPNFNLIVGENGSGKSSALDALAIGLGFLLKRLGIDEPKHTSFQESDIRYVASQSPLEPFRFESLPPTRVELVADTGWENTELAWFREFSDGLTEGFLSGFESPRDANPHRERPWEEAMLPVFARYGTDRARSFSELSAVPYIPDSKPDRMHAYEDALDPVRRPHFLIDWLVSDDMWGRTNPRYSGHGFSEVVRHDICSCIEGARDIRYMSGHGHVIIEFSNGQCVNYEDLSQGQRSLLAIAGDLAARAAWLNPRLGPLALKKATGVVLIDELDLHLHPAWQRRVIFDLRRLFPKIQFIATTHSPFLIQALRRGELINLNEPSNKGEPQEEYSDQSLEDIVEFVMRLEAPQRSRRYGAMMNAAEQYYSAVSNSDISEDELDHLLGRLREGLIPYGEDPAFEALLKIERLYHRGGAQRAPGE